MWLTLLFVYLVVSLFGIILLASNTDEPPTSWKQWLVGLLIGGPWMVLVGCILWCQNNLPGFSAKFNDWWNSLR
jgi:hypothetical protein